ncbi:MAG: hypothetical protein WCK28_00395 [Burkholderiales bacterium]
MTCFECGAPADHEHHVVPRSLGGTRTVPLCALCHGKAHGRERGFRNTPELTRAALAAKRERGESTGAAPYGYRADETGRLVKDADEQAVIARVRQARAEGLTVRAITERLRLAGVCSRRGRPIATSAVGVLVKEFAS